MFRRNCFYWKNWRRVQGKYGGWNMGLLLKVFNKSILSKRGDSLSARITSTGKQVLKLNISGHKRSAVRYPSGTIVETIVHKKSR